MTRRSIATRPRHATSPGRWWAALTWAGARARRLPDQPNLSYPCSNVAHVFEGGGFGVGLTVNQLDVRSRRSAELVPADRAWHPARLGELMPVASRNDVELAEEMRRVNIADSRLWAYRVEMIVQLAERRRDDRDRPAGTPGAASPSWSG